MAIPGEKINNSLVEKPGGFSDFCRYIETLYFSAHPDSFVTYWGTECMKFLSYHEVIFNITIILTVKVKLIY